MRIATLPDGKVIDQYTVDDEALHTPGPEENWQESVAMWCRDEEANLDVFMRLGHEPRMDGGNVTQWAFLQTPDCVFAHNEQFPLRAGDIGEASINAGGMGSYRYDGKCTTWGLKSDEVSWEFSLTPIHQPIPLYPAHNPDYVRAVGGAHFEVSDLMEGTVTIKGNTRRLRGLAYRDHSWGPRNWYNLKTHRWTAGVLSEERTFAFSNFCTDNTGISRRGYIREGSIIHYTLDVDILAYMESDAFCHRGGVITATLDDGTVHRIEMSPHFPGQKGNVSPKRGNLMFDGPAAVRWNGMTGGAILEVAENHRRGREPLTVLTRGYFGNGILEYEGQALARQIAEYTPA